MVQFCCLSSVVASFLLALKSIALSRTGLCLNAREVINPKSYFLLLILVGNMIIHNITCNTGQIGVIVELIDLFCFIIFSSIKVLGLVVVFAWLGTIVY